MNLINRSLAPLPAAIALLGLAGLMATAQAETFCPNGASQSGYGGQAFTNVSGPLDATCGTKSAVTLAIPDASTGYARLGWIPGSGLTFGNLLGLDASVSGQTGGQPFYMLSFYDPSLSLGQELATDQILMIEFQPVTVSGSRMLFDRSSTLVNLLDNTSDTVGYLAGGQADAHTLDYWLVQHPGLTNTQIAGVRIGIGMAGGCTGDCSQALTVDSLDVASPEPATLAIVGTVLFALGLTRKRRRV